MMCEPVIVNVFATCLRYVKLSVHLSKVCYDQLSLNYITVIYITSNYITDMIDKSFSIVPVFHFLCLHLL